MRVYSWNMFCFNRRPKAVLDFVGTVEADIVCLQEVPKKLLKPLKILFPHSEHTVDSERAIGKKDLTNYNVILSKYPLSKVHAIQHADIAHSLRTKITIRAMSPMGWAKIKNRNALAVTAHTPLGPIQVFNAHLTLASPSHRKAEFANLLTVRTPEIPAIIAGDFNILEHPRIKPLSWFLGASIKESLPSYPERELFEERFKNASLKNPHLGSVTHNFSQSQLDHVLVSESLTITDSGVHPHLNGSDHYPVFVDIHPHS